MKVKELVIFSFLIAILFVGQVALAAIPNVEIVSLLVVIYTRVFRKKVFFIIYGFVLLEGLMYGFGIWWMMYLYIWSILAIVVLCFCKQNSAVWWAIIAGIFGFVFGALCSIPYFFISGIHGAMAYWISGIPFDLIHGVSNSIVVFVLYKPLYGLLDQLTRNQIRLEE